MLTKPELNEIDKYAGARVKEAMKEAGYSQERLGKKCGVSFQQIQKYLTGANRMSISRLCQIADILDKPASYFLPESRNGDLQKFAMGLESIIKRYRNREDRMLEILTEK